MRVVTLCGSHHSSSTNGAVLRVIADRLVAHGVSVEPADLAVDVADFRPELVDDPPESVRRLRAQFDEADAVVLAVPEYAGGAPGWVKNITDWMVGSASLYGRAGVVVSASTSGGANAIDQVARTLTWQGCHVIATCGVAAPLTKVGDDLVVTDPDTAGGLERLADVLVEALAGGSERTAQLAEETLDQLGIPRVPGEPAR